MGNAMDPTGNDTHFDLVVIGFGKAGKTLAMQRAKAGDRVALIEQDAGMYGGTCINIGCVPTKALLSATSRGMNLREAQGSRDELVEAMNQANKKLSDDAGVTVINARARFTGERTVTLSGHADGSNASSGQTENAGLTLTGETVVINTGSVPVWPDLPGIDSPLVHDSTSVQHITPAPRRMAIVGGGPIGCEFASLFIGQGAEVTILDASPRPLSAFDPDVAAEACAVLKERGVTFINDARVSGFVTAGDQVTVQYKRGDDDNASINSNANSGSDNDQTTDLSVDACLVAIGRRPATDGLDLDAAGVGVGDRGGVVVDDYLRTSADGVFAAGDVTGGPQFTYVSLDDFRVIAGQLSSGSTTSGEAWSTPGRLIPTTTFIEPPLSMIGMSEDEARESGRQVDVRSSAVADIPTMPRPKIVGHPEGYVSFLVDSESDEILGASLFCVDSQELINTVAVAMRHGIRATQLGNGTGVSPAIREVEHTDLRPSEVLVRIAGVGICHTDLTAIDGQLPLPRPVVLGHEGSGFVEAVGPAVTGLNVGDVVVLSFASCGGCRTCAADRPAYCEHFAPLNYSGVRPDGTTTLRAGEQAVHGNWFGQSSWGTHAIADQRGVVRVAPAAGPATNADADLPVHLLGPLGCGLLTGAGTVINVLRPQPGQSIGFWGLGTVGLAGVMAAKAAGCETIVAVDLVDERLELARELGATHTINSSTTDNVSREIRNATGGLDLAM